MTDPINWPNPERPGVPMFPERDGLHVVMGPYDRVSVLVLWRSQTNDWLKGEIRFTPEEVLDARIAYGGPHLTATQVAELLAAERERCLRTARKVSDKYYEQRASSDNDAARLRANERMCAAAECCGAIRNLGAAP